MPIPTCIHAGVHVHVHAHAACTLTWPCGRMHPQVRHAVGLLHRIGAVEDESGATLTLLGEKLTRLQVHPMLGKVRITTIVPIAHGRTPRALMVESVCVLTWRCECKPSLADAPPRRALPLRAARAHRLRRSRLQASVRLPDGQGGRGQRCQARARARDGIGPRRARERRRDVEPPIASCLFPCTNTSYTSLTPASMVALFGR